MINSLKKIQKIENSRCTKFWDIFIFKNEISLSKCAIAEGLRKGQDCQENKTNQNFRTYM